MFPRQIAILGGARTPKRARQDATRARLVPALQLGLPRCGALWLGQNVCRRGQRMAMSVGVMS
jgi:hypothetical protein